MQKSLAGVAFENLGRAVHRTVVGRDHEVDAGVQMEGDLRVDDVGLVADEERHDELHRRRSLNTGPGDPFLGERQCERPAAEDSPHPQERKLRAVRADRAPLRESVARAELDGRERRPGLTSRVGLLGVEAEKVWPHVSRQKLVEPRVVGMRERRSRNEHAVGTLQGSGVPRPRRRRRLRGGRSRRSRTGASSE